MTSFFELDPQEQASRLQRLAAKQLCEWGVEGYQPRLLKYRENAVFEVETAAGERAALRVHRQNYHSEAALQSELRWMAWLADAGLRVPRPVPTLNGALSTDGRSDEAPGVWKIDVLGWLEGPMLGAVGEALDLGERDPEAVFFEIGQTMAKMHNASCDWPAQNAQQRHRWDLDGFLGEQPLWGRFWELEALSPQQKRFFVSVRETLMADLAEYEQSARNFGLIHADMVPENLLLGPEGIQVIDFDDAGFGWHLFDVVTALFWLAEEPNFDALQASLLAGYQSVRPLLQNDTAAMALFFALRSTTYLGWVHTRQNTETALELTPLIIEIAESVCRDYLCDRTTRSTS